MYGRPHKKSKEGASFFPKCLEAEGWKQSPQPLEARRWSGWAEPQHLEVFQFLFK